MMIDKQLDFQRFFNLAFAIATSVLASACGGGGGGGATTGVVPPPASTAVSTVTTIAKISTTTGTNIGFGSSTTETLPILSGVLSSELLAGEKLTVYIDSKVAGFATVNGKTWKYSSNAQLSIGSHSVATVVTSPSGNEGSRSPAWSFWVAPQPSSASVLPDSGVGSDKCFATASSNFVDCGRPEAQAISTQQDGMIGGDVLSTENSDGRLGFSYTKIDADGNALPHTASTWSCVLDNITGLTWEVKTSDGGLRDRLNTYTNLDDPNSKQVTGGSSPFPTQQQIDSPKNAVGFVAEVNAQGLCGMKDWRLPSVQEMVNIMDFGKTDEPALDPNWFGQTPTCGAQSSGQVCNAYAYWAASPPIATVPDSSFDAWSIATSSGAATRNSLLVHRSQDAGRVVRLVRGAQPTGSLGNRFSYSANGDEVSDKLTGLTWRRCPEGMSWSKANAACTGVPTALTHEQALLLAKSQTGWRVPNLKELFSIVESASAYPALNAGAFPNTLVTGSSFDYWTSTPDVSGGDSAWNVSFSTGQTQKSDRVFFKKSLRLVRATP